MKSFFETKTDGTKQTIKYVNNNEIEIRKRIEKIYHTYGNVYINNTSHETFTNTIMLFNLIDISQFISFFKSNWKKGKKKEIQLPFKFKTRTCEETYDEFLTFLEYFSESEDIYTIEFFVFFFYQFFKFF